MTDCSLRRDRLSNCLSVYGEWLCYGEFWWHFIFNHLLKLIVQNDVWTTNLDKSIGSVEHYRSLLSTVTQLQRVCLVSGSMSTWESGCSWLSSAPPDSYQWTGWYSGSNLDFHSWGIRFEFPPGYRLCLMTFRLYSVRISEYSESILKYARNSWFNIITYWLFTITGRFITFSVDTPLSYNLRKRMNPYIAGCYYF
jgi:hypothetical protein